MTSLSTHIQREMAYGRWAQIREQQAKVTKAQRIEFHTTLPISPQRKKPLVCDYIPLELSEEYMEHMKNKDDVVISGNTGTTLLISYPLRKPVKFKVHPEDSKGFTRQGFAQTIIEIYQMIYKKEKETMTGKETVMGESMLNRAVSNGKYGIWGHFLGDLILVEALEDKENGLWTLHIES